MIRLHQPLEARLFKEMVKDRHDLFIHLFFFALKVSVQCLAFSTVKSFTRQLELQFPPFKCQMWFAGEFKPKRGRGRGGGALIKCRMRLEKKKIQLWGKKKKCVRVRDPRGWCKSRNSPVWSVTDDQNLELSFSLKFAFWWSASPERFAHNLRAVTDTDW